DVGALMVLDGVVSRKLETEAREEHQSSLSIIHFSVDGHFLAFEHERLDLREYGPARHEPHRGRRLSDWRAPSFGHIAMQLAVSESASVRDLTGDHQRREDDERQASERVKSHRDSTELQQLGPPFPHRTLRVMFVALASAGPRRNTALVRGFAS